MTAFGEKFSQADIDALIAYLRTLMLSEQKRSAQRRRDSG